MLNLEHDNHSGIPVQFPSLRHSTRLSAILSAYDDLIENNRRRMALLEESARLLYRGVVRPPPLPRPRTHPYYQRRAGRMGDANARWRIVSRS